MTLKEKYVFDWKRMFKNNEYHIEYSIIDICNKKCISCSHLSPIAKEANCVNIDEFRRIIKIIKRLIPNPDGFWLTGGEPTLHPNLIELLSILREEYDSANIGFFTNGVKLKSYKNDNYFWNFIKEHDVIVLVTNYDIDKEFFTNLFKEKLCENNLSFVQNGNLFFKLVNYSNNQDISKEKYIKCGWERSKINIRNGKIYNCPSVEFVDLFNSYFLKSIVLSEQDYLVIDEYLTREKIDSFRGPVPFCANCNINNRYKKIIKNCESSKNIDEWSSFNQ